MGRPHFPPRVKGSWSFVNFLSGEGDVMREWQATVYRCPWCGRFYSSYLPEGSACRDHIVEWNEWLRKDIEKFNQRLASGGVRP